MISKEDIDAMKTEDIECKRPIEPKLGDCYRHKRTKECFWFAHDTPIKGIGRFFTARPPKDGILGTPSMVVVAWSDLEYYPQGDNLGDSQTYTTQTKSTPTMSISKPKMKSITIGEVTIEFDEMFLATGPFHVVVNHKDSYVTESRLREFQAEMNEAINLMLERNGDAPKT